MDQTKAHFRVFDFLSLSFDFLTFSRVKFAARLQPQNRDTCPEVVCLKGQTT